MNNIILFILSDIKSIAHVYYYFSIQKNHRNENLVLLSVREISVLKNAVAGRPMYSYLDT